jgi:O-antigen/teichoic acid export membrane protein
MIAAVTRGTPAAEESSTVPLQPRINAGSVMRAISWMAVGHTLSQLAWFGSLLVLAALVPPADFGAFAAAIVVIGVALLLTEGGTGGSLIASRDVTRGQLRHAALLNLAIGLGLCTVLVAGASVIVRTIATSSDPAVLRALSASIAFTAVAVVPMSLIQRVLMFKHYTVVTATAALVASIIAVLAAVMDAGVWALVARQVVYAGVIAVLGWWAAREIIARMPRSRARSKFWVRPPGAGSFLALASANLVALNLDYFIVGNRTDAQQLGLYALAFMLAFAPLTNFAWKLGTVFFPAASATEELATVARRTLRALRLMSLFLLPLLAPAVMLAPAVVGATLGDEWAGMVVPFQLLVVAGVGHAVINVFGDSLSGTGNIRLHAALQLVMCVVLAPALLILVDADGIRGAAIAHLLVFAVVGASYVALGARRLGIRVAAVGGALGPVAVPVLGQVAATAGAGVALAAAGLHGPGVAAIATLAGLAALVVLFRRGSWRPLEEAGVIVRAALDRGAR